METVIYLFLHLLSVWAVLASTEVVEHWNCSINNTHVITVSHLINRIDYFVLKLNWLNDHFKKVDCRIAKDHSKNLSLADIVNALNHSISKLGNNNININIIGNKNESFTIGSDTKKLSWGTKKKLVDVKVRDCNEFIYLADECGKNIIIMIFY